MFLSLPPMEFEQFLVGSKWKLLQEIGKKPQAASDLAKTLKTSIANTNQQLKLLEAYGVIKKEKQEQTKKAGKPKTLYDIKKEEHYLITLMPGKVKKRRIPPFWGQNLFFNTLDLNIDDQYFITKFCFFTEDILKHCDGVAFLKSTKETVELVLLTTALEKIRQEYSNVQLSTPEGTKKKIVCWTHSKEELENGLVNKEKYFLDLIKDYHIVYDREGVLATIQNMRGAQP